MMKVLLITITLFVVANTKSDTTFWNEFKINNGKNYKSLVEDKYRFSIFQKNLRQIEKHNAKYEQGLVSYFLKPTKFADLTDNEFADKVLCYTRPKINYTSKFVIENDKVVPKSIDWRIKGVVLEVKDQGNCGACYAFSATGALEGQNAIKHNKRISLSEQELVDCSGPAYLNSGCNGGGMERCFMYIQDYGGISTEKSYPYKGKAGSCSRAENAGIKVLGYVEVGMTEKDLKAAVGTAGPISVAMNSKEIKLYGGGIFDSNCTDDLNHGVLVVGYDTQENEDYWIIKNSWGPQWGERGYLRIASNKKLCGLGIESTYPRIA